MKSNIGGGMAAVLVVIVIAIIAVVAWKMFSGPGITPPSQQQIQSRGASPSGGSNDPKAMMHMQNNGRPGGMGGSAPAAPPKPAGQ